MMFSTRSWRSDGRNVRTRNPLEILSPTEFERLLTHMDELQTFQGMPNPFGSFELPRGEHGPAVPNPHAQMQPANLQEYVHSTLDTA